MKFELDGDILVFDGVRLDIEAARLLRSALDEHLPVMVARRAEARRASWEAERQRLEQEHGCRVILSVREGAPVYIAVKNQREAYAIGRNMPDYAILKVIGDHNAGTFVQGFVAGTGRSSVGHVFMQSLNTKCGVGVVNTLLPVDAPLCKHCFPDRSKGSTKRRPAVESPLFTNIQPEKE